MCSQHAPDLNPRKLTSEEITDPYLVIYGFFDFADINFQREFLWELLKVTTSSSFHKQTRREKADMLTLYEQIEKLVEAAHIIHQREKARNPKKIEPTE